MASVTAIIPTWNRRDLLEALLARLPGQTCAFEQVIVVDNGSTDGSAEAAVGYGAKVLRLESNRGFAAAVNAGIKEARTDWVAIVNNDVILEANWLETLLAAAVTAQAWFAVGKLLAPDHVTIDGTFDLISRGACSWRAGSGRPDGPLWNQARPVSFAPLTAALFRRNLFERIGLLEEAFQSYLEDVDLGLRCAAAGLGGCYVPEARATHLGSATLGRWSGASVRLIARNQLLLAARYTPKEYWWQVAVGQSLWGLLALRHGAAVAFLRGKYSALWDFSVWRKMLSEDARRAIGTILEASENEIRELQRRTGYDWYWRAYMTLAATPRKGGDPQGGKMT